MKEKALNITNWIIKFALIVAACVFFWLAFVDTFLKKLCEDISTCYSIVIFLIGIILTLKIRILEEEKKSLELSLFIAGSLINIIFLITAFVTDCYDKGENKDALLILNGAIWWNFIITIRNIYLITIIFCKKHFVFNERKTNIDYTFRYIVERDADFAIINAFEQSKSVRKLFLKNFRSPNAKLVEVKHSYMQQEPEYGFGESDIIFLMEDKEGLFGIFVENKIKAKAQPLQRERYDVRANQFVELDGNYKVFLCAPTQYLKQDSKDVNAYENQIAYKKIIERMPYGVERSILEKAEEGNSCTMVDSGVTSFWSSFYDFIKENYEGVLTLKGSKKDRPSGSMWQEFETGINGCFLTMKVDSRRIDLEFAGMGLKLSDLNALFKRLNINNEAIRTNKGKSKSASIILEIDEEYGVSFYVPFEEQIHKVCFWINKIIELNKYIKILKEQNYLKFPIDTF